jgi:hypothetical protein
MKKTLVLACSLVLVAVAGFAQTPSQHRVTLAEIMAPAPTPAPAPAAPAQDQPLFVASHGHGRLPVKATCTANCASGTVTCNSSSPSTCVAVDRNCPSTQGYVTCDGVTTYCPTSCSTTCTEGATRYLATGYCCDDSTKEKEEQVCSGGIWQYTGNFICMGLCGPRVP